MNTQTEPTPAASILDQAIDWWLVLRDEAVDSATLDRFSIWIAADPRHAGAFAEAERLFQDMVQAATLSGKESLTATTPNPARITPTAKSLAAARFKPRAARRRLGWLAAAAAAVWLVLAQPWLAQASLFGRLTSDYYTRAGEIKAVTLPDGSQILLNTDSAVKVNYAALERGIELLYGQARFEAAPDARRPFAVRAGELSVRALGTVFDVYRMRQDTQIVVERHAVSISNLAAAGEAVRVAEGQQLRFRAGQGLPPPEPVNLKQAVAWQSRKLVVADQPLSVVFTELERYRGGRIVTLSPELERLRVTGIFTLDASDSAARKICLALNLQTQMLGTWMFVWR